MALMGFVLLFTACNNSKQSKSEKTNTGTPVNEVKVVDAQYTGELTEEDLVNSSYTNRWFSARKEQYVPHKASLATIKKHINDYTIEVFLGTWCPDSQAEIPRFFSILDETDFDQAQQLSMYTLDHNNESKTGEEKGKNITNVPTIIFYKDEKEVNRFVESPRESLARDMAKIVSGKEYKNIYE